MDALGVGEVGGSYRRKCHCQKSNAMINTVFNNMIDGRLKKMLSLLSACKFHLQKRFVPRFGFHLPLP